MVLLVVCMKLPSPPFGKDRPENPTFWLWLDRRLGVVVEVGSKIGRRHGAVSGESEAGRFDLLPRL